MLQMCPYPEDHKEERSMPQTYAHPSETKRRSEQVAELPTVAQVASSLLATRPDRGVMPRSQRFLVAVLALIVLALLVAGRVVPTLATEIWLASLLVSVCALVTV